MLNIIYNTPFKILTLFIFSPLETGTQLYHTLHDGTFCVIYSYIHVYNTKDAAKNTCSKALTEQSENNLNSIIVRYG